MIAAGNKSAVFQQRGQRASLHGSGNWNSGEVEEGGRKVNVDNELRGQMAAQQGAVADLRSRVNAIPEIEAELARLNRDYEVNKEQYDTLLQRLESAKISQQADQNTENVKFRIIEPPTTPVTWRIRSMRSR